MTSDEGFRSAGETRFGDPDLGIDGYENPTLIGQGGFGSVYRCDQPSFGRQVAIKVLSAPAFDEDVRRRFRRECKAIGSLSGDPHIVTVYDSGISSLGRPYIVMEYLERDSLAAMIANPPTLSWKESVEIGVKIARALDGAHSRGILHRDIKPENILMSRYGEPKLADFGISKLSDGTMTRSGIITASIGHAAPELFDGAPASPASDVYALASTLYEVLAGQPAFEKGPDEPLPSLVMRIMTNDLPPLPPSVPAEVQAAIGAAMRKDPGERPASAEEFARNLQVAAGSEDLNGLSVSQAGSKIPDHRPEDSRLSHNDGAEQNQRPERKTVMRERKHVIPTADPPPVERRPRFKMAVLLAAVLLLASAGGTYALMSSGPKEAKADKRGQVVDPPASPEPTPTATVPTVERVKTKGISVRFSKEKRLLFGTIRSAKGACVSRRVVEIRRAGVKHPLKKVRSDAKGHWQMRLGKKSGTFVSSTEGTLMDLSDDRSLRCSDATSRRIKVLRDTPVRAAGGTTSTNASDPPSVSAPPEVSVPNPPSEEQPSDDPCAAGWHSEDGFCVRD